MSELSISMSPPKVPSSFINGPVAKLHVTTTMSESAQPLTIIHSTRSAIDVQRRCQILLELGLILVKKEIEFDSALLRDSF